jgi:histidine ammonia-lyase
MATGAALRLYRMIDNVAGIVAIELLAAAQGVEFHRPLRSSPPLEAALAVVRAVSPRLERDRALAGDIRALQRRILEGCLGTEVRLILPSGRA